MLSTLSRCTTAYLDQVMMTTTIAKILTTLIVVLGICLPSAGQDAPIADSQINEQYVLEIGLDSTLQIVRDRFYDQNFVDAIQLGQLAVSIAQDENDLKNFVQISSLLGTSLSRTGDQDEAKRVFTAALEAATAQGDKRQMLGTQIDLANMYAQQKEWQTAILEYKKSIPLAIAEGDKTREFILNYNIAESYLQLGRPKQAGSFIARAEELGADLKPLYLAGLHLVKGWHLVGIKEYEEALPILEKSLSTANSQQYVEGQLNSYKQLSKAYAGLGQYDKAYDMLLTQQELESEQYEKEKIEAVKEANAEFKVKEARRQVDVAANEAQFESAAARQRSLTYILIAAGIALLVILFTQQRAAKRRQLLVEDLKAKNAQYLEAKEESEKLVASKTALFSKISHELRTPMYGITGIAGMLQSDEDIKKRFAKPLASLRYSADYLLTLINSVLEMNRLDNTEMNLPRTETLNLQEVGDYIVDTTRFIDPGKNNKVSLSITGLQQRHVMGDSAKLSQVLLNLTNNASKHTQEGHIQVVMQQVHESDTHVQVRFQVIDNGRGMKPETLNSLKEERPAEQWELTASGTGLGIPITRKLLQQMGGELSIESSWGNGTTFSFHLEFVKAMQVKPKVVTNYDGCLHNRSILIVDDNKINLMVSKKTVEKLGGNGVTVASGEQALEQLKEKQFDLVLMDINMPPGMDGFETTRAIRNMNLSVPVIALTAVEQHEIEERMKQSSMNDVLIKPYKEDHFCEVLTKHLVNDSNSSHVA